MVEGSGSLMRLEAVPSETGVEAMPVVTTPAVAATATEDSITVLRSTLRGARPATTEARDLRCFAWRCFGTCLPDV